jgi:pimeloyl-ACP methyl ester carboxylesterase
MRASARSTRSRVWADVAHHYDLDPTRVALSGFSMGAIGTFRLASLYPDLFTRGLPMAGHGADVTDIADNLLPRAVLMWNGVPDELVHINDVLLYRRRSSISATATSSTCSDARPRREPDRRSDGLLDADAVRGGRLDRSRSVARRVPVGRHERRRGARLVYDTPTGCPTSPRRRGPPKRGRRARSRAR